MLVLKRTIPEESPMQSTSFDPLPAISTSSPCSSASFSGRVVSPTDLLSAFAKVPDPRRRQGTRFALSAILSLAVAAILSNHLSVLAIAEWGASQCHDLLGTLGFSDGVTPHQSTLQRLLRRLDPDALSGALTSHLAGATDSPAPPRASQAVAIDGKAQRGRLAFDSAGCPVHALAAFLHDRGLVLAQEPIEAHPQAPEPARAEAGANAKPLIDKAEAELSVAPDLIKRLDWHGRVLTGDALFCQRKVCDLVVSLGGDYLLTVKANQPRLYEDIRLLFDPPPGIALPLADCRQAKSLDHGHGRYHDARKLTASTDLSGYSHWPHLAQAYRLERTWQEKGQTKGEVRYGITSLPPEVADAERLLALKRGHWQIENRLHYVKDVTLGEDKSLVHLGNGPSVLAILRDLALSLLHQAGFRGIASRLRYHSLHPEAAVALLLASPCQNA
jgi:predicted transposase YbfD/YdcC